MTKPKTVPNKLLIGFSDEQLAGLDNWRRMQQDMPSRSEGVRRLVHGGLQQPGPKSSWKGLLRLSLVTCPIAMIPATSGNEQGLHPDDGDGGTPSKLPGEGPAVAPAIDIDLFVARAEVDYRYIIRPYYMVPDGKVGHDAFAVIREAMRYTNKTALARVTLANRQRVLAIDPRDDGMVGLLLRYPFEVSSSDHCFEKIQDIKITKDMLELAKHIVDNKTGTFDPEAWMKPEMKGSGPPIASNEKPGNVINLMDALKRMLATEKKGSGVPTRALRHTSP